jgi:hypothetical protein
LCGINARSFQVIKLFPIAFATALFMSASVGVVLAQTPSGNDTTAAPAPAAPAPAASPAPAATPAPSDSPSASTPPATDQKTTSMKKKKGGARMTRQQEIDHSINSGTVPSRYRSQVPKEYQQYVPFEK